LNPERDRQVDIEKEFLSIIGAIPGLVGLLTIGGELDAVNPQFLEYSGQSLEQLRKWDTNGTIHCDDIVQVGSIFARSASSGEPYDYECRIRRFDGVFRWFQVRGVPIHDAGGNISRWVVVHTDIDERKRAEGERRQALAQLSLAQRLSATGSFTADVVGDEHIWSEELYRICEFEPGSTVTLQKLRDIVHSEDLATFDAVVERSARGYDADFEFRIVTRGGRLKHLRAAARISEHVEGRPIFMGAVQDITDRRVTEEALRESELYARLMVDSIPGMVAVFNSDGVVEYVNSQALEYFGKTVEELRQWQFSDACHPDDLARSIELFGRSLATGEIFDYECRSRRHDGVYLWHRTLALPLRDRNGAIIRWYNLLVDIDKRKRAEEALAASEAELRRAYNSFRDAQRLSKTASFVTDLLADDHNWSEEAFRIFEFEPGSKVTVERIRALVHPDDLQSFDAVIEQGSRGADVNFLFRIVTSSGNLKHIHGMAHVVELIEGRPTFVGALSDVTESKVTEETLKTSEAFLAEGQRLSSSGTFLWRFETNEIIWSSELYHIFEFEPGTPVSLERIGSRVHPDDMPMLYDMTERAAAATDFEYQHRLLMPDQSVKHLHLVGHARRDTNGQLEYIGAAQDVTKSKLAEEALNAARSELAHVARTLTLSALTASIAHEVNQPLAGIVTNASTSLRMLSANPPNLEGVSTATQRTLRDANRATEVITRLRSMFTRREPSREPVDLNEATREVIALSWSDLQRSNVIVRTELADNLPKIDGDRVQLQQVILNLILNASDAMSGVTDRQRRLVIRTERTAGADVKLTVEDSGVGFNPEIAGRLFEAFYTTKGDGMGIGLSISRSIIENHRGHLSAKPMDNGPGAAFSFSIPGQAQPSA
jgi:PAS domain S-box-containing protein